MARHGKIIVAFLLQGRPRVMLDAELDGPALFDSIPAAEQWLRTYSTAALRAAETILAIDLGDGYAEEISCHG